MGIDHQKKRVGDKLENHTSREFRLHAAIQLWATEMERFTQYPVVHAELRMDFSCRMMCFSNDFPMIFLQNFPFLHEAVSQWMASSGRSISGEFLETYRP